MNIEGINKIKTIDELMDKWFKYSRSKWPEAVFVKDGPFCYYWQQKIKILFVARELPGKIDKGEEGSFTTYQDERECMIKLGIFQSRLLYLAYGIINGESTEQDWIASYDSGNGARKLNQKFAEDPKLCDGAFSYAAVNASKLLNSDGKKIGKLFHAFISDEINRAFFLREINLLKPDIIISANLADLKFFKDFEGRIDPDVKSSYSSENCTVWNYKSEKKDKQIPWLDTWHFTAGKETFKCFYRPICVAAKELLGK